MLRSIRLDVRVPSGRVRVLRWLWCREQLVNVNVRLRGRVALDVGPGSEVLFKQNFNKKLSIVTN